MPVDLTVVMMSGTFTYDTLEPKFIRLFKLDSSATSSCLSGILVVFRHPCHYDATVKGFKGRYSNWNDKRFTEKQGDAYGYDALSYTWGNPEETFPLKLRYTGKVYKKGILQSDGITKREGQIVIHQNLHDLLVRLVQMRYDRRWIWIDAICINQTDKNEKNMQIPLMRDIYYEARQVDIWLGQASAAEEKALSMLPDLVKMLEEVSAKCQASTLNPRQPETFESSGLPAPSHPLWEALRSIMIRHWFRRLWTLQEAVLPETSVLLCGSKTITWRTLEAFVAVIWDCRLANWVTTGDVDIQTGYLNGFDSVRMINWCRKSVATAQWGVHLDILLNATRKRYVTNPVDMVFGMMALMPHGDQAQINIDTSLLVERVYYELARYYIENELDECILNHVSSETRHSDLPSWCPDFSSPETTVPLSSLWYGSQRLNRDQYDTIFRAGFKEKGLWQQPMNKYWCWIMAKNALHRRRLVQGILDHSHPLHMSCNLDNMKTLAHEVVVDKVSEVVHQHDGIGKGAAARNVLENTIKTLVWEERCLALARKTLGSDHAVPEIYWRTLIANLTCESNGSHIKWDEFDQANHSNAYQQFKDCNRDLASGDSTAMEGMNADARVYGSELIRVTRRRCFFRQLVDVLDLGLLTLSQAMTSPSSYSVQHHTFCITILKMVATSSWVTLTFMNSCMGRHSI